MGNIIVLLIDNTSFPFVFVFDNQKDILVIRRMLFLDSRYILSSHCWEFGITHFGNFHSDKNVLLQFKQFNIMFFISLGTRTAILLSCWEMIKPVMKIWS